MAYSHVDLGDPRQVSVKNTFIELVDPEVPSPLGLQRASTAPGRRSTTSRGIGDSSDSENGEAPAPDSHEGEAPTVPERPTRETTETSYEKLEKWNWTRDAAAMAPAQPLLMYAQMPMQMVSGASMMPIIVGPSAGSAYPSAGEQSSDPSVGQPQTGARWPQGSTVGNSMAGSAGVPVAGSIEVSASSLGNPADACMRQGVANALLPLSPYDGDASLGGGLAAPQPQTLTRHLSINSGLFRVHWTVDARKLKGGDKQAVSPPFELSFGDQYPRVTFKMMIYPMVVNDAKGGASFKRSSGKGFVQLKCEAELSAEVAHVAFRISIASATKETPKEIRGPVHHNFSTSAVAGLPKNNDVWNFVEAVDTTSMTFVVCLEIVPRSRDV